MLKRWLWAVLILAVGVSVYAAEPLQLEDFLPAEKCGSCPVEVYQQEQTSNHSLTATNLACW